MSKNMRILVEASDTGQEVCYAVVEVDEDLLKLIDARLAVAKKLKVELPAFYQLTCWDCSAEYYRGLPGETEVGDDFAVIPEEEELDDDYRVRSDVARMEITASSFDGDVDKVNWTAYPKHGDGDVFETHAVNIKELEEAYAKYCESK